MWRPAVMADSEVEERGNDHRRFAIHSIVLLGTVLHCRWLLHCGVEEQSINTHIFCKVIWISFDIIVFVQLIVVERTVHGCFVLKADILNLHFSCSESLCRYCLTELEKNSKTGLSQSMQNMLFEMKRSSLWYTSARTTKTCSGS